MPLTKKGKKVLKEFKKQYGKERGKMIFYSYLNKHPKKTKDWHRIKSKKKKGLASASRKTRIRVARKGGKASR